jgi:dipeptidyl aminopeptidase/acylaminoacyl peptidase
MRLTSAALMLAIGLAPGTTPGVSPVAGVGSAIDGSVQNPAWSPDGSQLLVTVWRGGYNVGPADLVFIDLATDAFRTLVADGLDNVNMPGSSWSAVTGEVTFSSTADPHDEIWAVAADGAGEPRLVTLHDDAMAYEPTWSPDGDAVVYEVHPLDVEGEGRIARSPADGDGATNVAAEVFLTPEGDDCRQPVWGPSGDQVVFQCTADGGESWTLFVADPDGEHRRPLATGELDATDASSPPMAPGSCSAVATTTRSPTCGRSRWTATNSCDSHATRATRAPHRGRPTAFASPSSDPPTTPMAQPRPLASSTSTSLRWADPRGGSIRSLGAESPATRNR